MTKQPPIYMLQAYGASWCPRLTCKPYVVGELPCYGGMPQKVGAELFTNVMRQETGVGTIVEQSRQSQDSAVFLLAHSWSGGFRGSLELSERPLNYWRSFKLYEDLISGVDWYEVSAPWASYVDVVIAPSENIKTSQAAPSLIDHWSIVRGDQFTIQQRIEALHEIRLANEEDAASFVVCELTRVGLAPSWRNGLILFAEHVQFESDELRERLRDCLLQYAIMLRESTEAGIKPVVLSAIRTYASLLLDPSDAVALQPLLDPPKPIETRLVALQCIVHLFERRPPQQADRLPRLSDRVYELADKFLDKDWLVAGEKAAIGQNATHALASLGDERLRNCIETINSLEMHWLTRQVARKLETTLHTWRNDPELTSHPAFTLVHEQLNELRP